jgi:hypothetical protein
VNDDDLLRALHDALAPEAAEPPAELLHSIHAAVDLAIARTAKVVPFRPRGILRTAIGVAAACLAVLAVARPMPRAVRHVAYTVGLPVTSPQLDDAYHHQDQLRDALEHNDPAAIASAAARLRSDRNELGAHHNGQFGEQSNQLLEQADTKLNESGARTNETGSPTTTDNNQPSPDTPGDQPTGSAGQGATNQPDANGQPIGASDQPNQDGTPSQTNS